MPLAPWKISLISTDYDMHDIRADLGEFLTNKGFSVLAYERADYPVHPDVHSHDACLIALNQADIIILIIDKRYGGLYLGKGPHSITEAEYDAATRNKKIIIPFIRRRAWDERHQLFESEKNLRAERIADPRKLLKPTYVDSWEVLDFIERVRNADINNFIEFFDDLADLRPRLEGRLRGISFWLFQMLVRDQMRQVKDMKTSTAMGFSLGDVLDQGYFIDPPYQMKSGGAMLGETPTDVLRNFRHARSCVAILGEPGSGKSTLLGKTFIEHAQESISSNSPNLPFFMSLRGRGTFAFDYQSCVNEFFSVSFLKTPYPILSLDSIHPSFYMDGFDEISESQSAFDASCFCKSTIYSFPFVFACRSRYANENLARTAVGDRLSAVIELQPWDKPTTTRYIEEFCRIRNRTDLIAGLKDAFASSSEMNEITGNPLLLTLFLCLVEEAGMKVPLDVRNKRTLLAKTLEMWARRELGRLRGLTGVSAQEEALLLQAWRIAAWWIYRARFNAAPPIKVENLLALVKEILPEAGSICEREALVGIFDMIGHTDEIIGLVHEQLLEELVAEFLVEGMLTGKRLYPDSLSVAVRWEINQLIRSLWSEFDNAKLEVSLANLVGVFNMALSDDSTSGILCRNQAAYYMGRLGIPQAVSELRKVDYLEQNPFVKLSIGFGLIKRMQYDVEEAFVRKLQDDKNWDELNRGYHLYYYRDHNIGLNKDPGNVPWENTLRALMRHIESSEDKHIAIRRVELITIRRFIEARGTRGPLTEEIIKRIEDAVQLALQSVNPSLSANFKAGLEAEFQALRATWQAARL